MLSKLPHVSPRVDDLHLGVAPQVTAHVVVLRGQVSERALAAQHLLGVDQGGPLGWTPRLWLGLGFGLGLGLVPAQSGPRWTPRVDP